MAIEQINQLKPEKFSAPADPAATTDELLEEALVTLTPELEGWRGRSGNKDDGILRLVMRVHETRCDLAWIELQAWVSRIGTASGSERVSISGSSREATLATARGTDSAMQKFVGQDGILSHIFGGRRMHAK